jgi:neurotrimin
MIWIQNQLVGAQVGQEITLECLSEAFPKSVNYWTRDNDDIIANSKFIIFIIISLY